MRCATCGYRLWHLTARICPECGTPFRPSDYDFVPNSIEFCCPQCGQPYYGTDAQGLLEPRAFDCISCGRYIHLDEMLVRPAPGVDERETQVEQLPWLDLGERGVFRAWWGTILMALFTPGRLMRLLPMDAPLKYGFWFSALTFFVSHLLMWLALLAWMIFVVAMSLQGQAGGGGGMGFALFFFCGMGLVGPVIAILSMVLWASVAHAILRLTGRTHGTWNRTMQAFCYSSGSYAVGIVPCCGMYVAPLWFLVSAVLAVREGQKVHGGRATLAVASLPVVAVLSLIGLQIAMYHSAVTYVPSPINLTAGAQTDTHTVLLGLLRFKDAHQGRWPAHALSLAEDGYVSEYDFVGSYTPTSISKIPVAGMSLEEYANRSAAERARLAEQAAKSLPADVVAHRLGDFVFTYRGIDPGTADPRLWVVVFAPEPSADPADRSVTVLMAGLLDGTTLPVRDGLSDPTIYALLMQEQNQLRAQAGLPPLPDPQTVTHTQPATYP